MCGFKAQDAIGQNPRITQGKRSQPEVIKDMSHALQNQRACKVRIVNYRSGHEDQPFWNILTISPVTFRGALQFYLANLQDYSHLIEKLISVSPAQFCKAAEYAQKKRYICKSEVSSVVSLARPVVYEADETFTLGEHEMARPPDVALPVKRLGWEGLEYDPEYIADRISDAFLAIGASFERCEGSDSNGESIRIRVKSTKTPISAYLTEPRNAVPIICARSADKSVSVVINIHEESEGKYRVACARLAGDTFAFHDLFREMKQHLGDALTKQSLLRRAPTAVPPTMELVPIRIV